MNTSLWPEEFDKIRYGQQSQLVEHEQYWIIMSGLLVSAAKAIRGSHTIRFWRTLYLQSLIQVQMWGPNVQVIDGDSCLQGHLKAKVFFLRKKPIVTKT